ncbi:efflux RND transporter periplasmic adaptor subunit [Membranihabitans marinus]|uniref:efflux RND transporter periplasmic adaptor subunit n=1 Tax=Membranihabitans marinus TaxID=1227546 RepID=UPI001F2B4D72|nr:HlyD family efflux transporter periplasmic adaptor subunit [Membranihabitans marinus]
MDRPITIKEQRKKKYYRIIKIIVLGLGLISVLLIARKWLNPSIDLNQLTTDTVIVGEIQNMVTATGIVKPSSELVINSPIDSKIQSIALENGSLVSTNDAIMNLDVSFLTLENERLQDELQLKQNNVNRLQLSLEKDIRELQLDDEIKALELKNLEGQLSDAQRLFDLGGATEEEVEQAQQRLKIAELEKSKLENELSYRQASIHMDVSNEKITSSIQKKRIDELKTKIKLANVTAPLSGVITWIDQTIGKQVREGDPIVRIADLHSYSIEGEASDMHSDKIQLGQNVQIRLGDEIMKGSIEQIRPALENNTIQFRIKLEDESSPRWRPNMEVDVRIITATKSQVLTVANGTAFRGRKTSKIFVLQDQEAVARSVNLGMITPERVEILSGLSAGETIILSDMSVYEQFQKIKIK